MQSSRYEEKAPAPLFSLIKKYSDTPSQVEINNSIVNSAMQLIEEVMNSDYVKYLEVYESAVELSLLMSEASAASIAGSEFFQQYFKTVSELHDSLKASLKYYSPKKPSTPLKILQAEPSIVVKSKMPLQVKPVSSTKASNEWHVIAYSVGSIVLSALTATYLVLSESLKTLTFSSAPLIANVATKCLSLGKYSAIAAISVCFSCALGLMAGAGYLIYKFTRLLKAKEIKNHAMTTHQAVSDLLQNKPGNKNELLENILRTHIACTEPTIQIISTPEPAQASLSPLYHRP